MGNTVAIVKNLMWKFGERCGAQAVSFIISLILARLIEPELYGQLAIVLAFTNILQVFIDNGLGNSLIQNKDSDDIDFSSVFYFNLFLSLLLYSILFFVSPYIAEIYDNSLLISYIRVMSLSIIVSGIKNIQQAYVAKHLIFKKFFFSTLIGTVTAGVISIVMAFNGFGIWSLIAYYLLNNSIDTLILWITVRWRPNTRVSLQRLKKMLPFGITVFLSSLLNSVYGELRQLLIGKKYSDSDLAYYNRGRQFPLLFVENINAAIDGVLFPTMSNESKNSQDIKQIAQRTIIIATFIFAPLLLGLMAISKPLVIFLLTDKWASCIPFIKVFCIIYLFQPLHMANKIAIKSMGKGNILIRQEVINDIVGIVVLILSVRYGVLAIALAYLLSNTFDLFVNSYPNKKLINYSLFDQIKDIFPIIVLSSIMALIVYYIPSFNIPIIIVLFIKITIGVIVYILLSRLFKINAYYSTKSILKRVFIKRDNC